MNKKLFIILVIILVGGIGIGLFILNDKEPSLYVEKPSEDALKFKEEYESLNGTKRESDGAIYQDIKIDENNPVKYVNAKEALEVLKNKTAIMYVGANWCPWCRNAVPVLFEVAKDKNIETIYYLNLDDEKDSLRGFVCVLTADAGSRASGNGTAECKISCPVRLLWTAPL